MDALPVLTEAVPVSTGRGVGFPVAVGGSFMAPVCFSGGVQTGGRVARRGARGLNGVRRYSGRHKCRPYGASAVLRWPGKAVFSMTGTKKREPPCEGRFPLCGGRGTTGGLTRLVVDGADADAVPVGLAEHVADALAFGGDAVGRDVVFVHEDFLDSFGARLGDFGVDFGRTFGRGVALDDDARGGVVAQVGGHAFYVGQLRGVDDGLALAEGDDGFEFLARAGDGRGLDDGFAFAQGFHLLAEGVDAAVGVAELLVLFAKGAAHVVHLGVEAIDFAVIIGAHDSEVVAAVAALEVVGEAGGQFEIGVVDVIVAVAEVGVAVDAVCAVHVPDNGGLDGDGPGVVKAEVELEVEAGFRGPSVDVVRVVEIVVQPSGAGDGFDFEDAGVAEVAAEEIHEVDAAEETEVRGVERGFAFGGVDGPEAFDVETEDGGHLLAEADSDGGACVGPEGVMGQRADDAAVEGDGPVVREAGRENGFLRLGAWLVEGVACVGEPSVRLCVECDRHEAEQ